MATTRLSKAKYVEHGYAQVEANHLSAQRTGQIYAQLPADSSIDVLENGQFVKYDYATGKVNFSGKGEWMMVFNEVKLYRDFEQYDDFAMKKTDYNARVYSPVGQKDAENKVVLDYTGEAKIYDSTEPYKVQQYNMEYPKDMPSGSTMVPRVVKTNIGDLITTNAVDESTLAVNDELQVNSTNGFLAKVGGDSDGSLDKEGIKFIVVKVYTLADYQQAVKIQRIA